MGTGPIHLGALQCTGTELILADCVNGSIASCSHQNDAGVVCQNSESLSPQALPLIGKRVRGKGVWSVLIGGSFLWSICTCRSEAIYSYSIKEHYHILFLTGICANGDVRLVGGSSMFEGRVEMCYNEVYGTICDIGFGRPEAAVVCSKLGFSRLRKSEI